MRTVTFHRGIHPQTNKARTASCPIRKISCGTLAIYPLAGGMGAPAEPVVAKGDSVKVGQMLAQANGFFSLPVYSGVSGTVKAVEYRPGHNGLNTMCVVVENDGQDTMAEAWDEPRDPASMTPEEIRAAIQKAGIAGMGGAGFPMHVKLTPPEGSKIDYVILNGAECEPYLTADARLMVERPEDIVQGLEILLLLFPEAEGVIAVEDNKPEAIAALNRAVEGKNRMRVQPLKTKYPQGGERMLIHAVTGRDVDSSRLPAHVGCVVSNVASTAAVGDAVLYGKPVIERVMTVSGDGIERPDNLLVPVGTQFKDVIAACGGAKETTKKYISGGPMMGTAVFDLEVPVMRTSSGLLAFTEDPVAKHAPSPCIRCGKCVAACPEGLLPQQLAVAATHMDYARFAELHGMECILCGSCAYVCPAYRPLTQCMMDGRQAVREKRHIPAKERKEG